MSSVKSLVDPWDMHNNFCFHVSAQKLLFIDENDNVFLTTASPSPVTLDVIELVPSCGPLSLTTILIEINEMIDFRIDLQINVQI